MSLLIDMKGLMWSLLSTCYYNPFLQIKDKVLACVKVDHRPIICFEAHSERMEEEFVRTRKLTDRALFRQKLILILEGFQVIVYDSKDLGKITESLMKIIWAAYEQICPH